MPDDPNTTAVLDGLFTTLRRYSQTQKISETDILRERARQYAQRQDAPAPTTDTLTALTFRIDDEHYALEVIWVQGVRPLPRLTRVPGSQPYYTGVMNVRGAVMTQFDLRLYFGLGRTQEMGELVMIQYQTLSLGIPVTRVEGVVTLERGKIRPMDEVRYALGVSGNTLILNADEIFNGLREDNHNEQRR